jgi:hypothetical protein
MINWTTQQKLQEKQVESVPYMRLALDEYNSRKGNITARTSDRIRSVKNKPLVMHGFSTVLLFLDKQTNFSIRDSEPLSVA